MPLPIYRLRRWLMAITVLFMAVIAGMYFYARMRERDVLKEIPNKIGIDIKQTASGFQFSKSDGKRTLFTIQATDLKQFKVNGSAELHNVTIILYGRDSSRFDQVYGDDFAYDKNSGNVTAQGQVQIDLQANPAGEAEPDQSVPKQLKNPIHLKTRDLVFNQKSGDAHTSARVDFQTPQATGWAVGVEYSAKTNTLTLESQIHLTTADNETIVATHGRITRDPRVVILENPRLDRTGGTVQADEATLFLGSDNTVERVSATGNVIAHSNEENGEEMRARADQGEMLLAGKRDLLQSATFTGNVHVEESGPQSVQGDAGKAVLEFAGRNVLQEIHAADGVHLRQNAAGIESTTTKASGRPQQDFDITAPVIDFFIADGNRLDRALTSGAPQIMISAAADSSTLQAAGQRTVVTAGRFVAKFVTIPAKTRRARAVSRLASVHGAPAAKIVNSQKGAPDRVSTSDMLDATFLPQGGIAEIVQQGNLAYSDNQPPEKRTQAWAEKATYNPGTELLELNGSPRVVEGGMETTAITIRINRAASSAFADGDVKSTYSELKEQPDGALLASSSPIHVTSAHMETQNSGAVALYEEKARLWQDANMIAAPSIRFDRNSRSLLAVGTPIQPVSTVLVQATKPSSPQAVAGENRAKKLDQADAQEVVAITARSLSYKDSERRAHYEGSVNAKGTGFTAVANTADIFFFPRSQSNGGKGVASASRLDRMIAEGDVVIQQPGRTAKGQKLVYTAAEDKFVLTGGPPSIFDAERGKITGDSLTFFRSDGRVLVEGEASTPVVTQTRMAH